MPIKVMKMLAANRDVAEIDRMEMEIKTIIIKDHDGLDEFRTLLSAVGLPYQDLSLENSVLLGYYDDDKLIGTGALEIYGQHALLRSLAVNDALRGRMLGSKITDDLIDQARKNNIRNIYLLTDTARLFFKRKGFKDIDREQVPDAVKASSEFSGVCPETAVCMEYKVPTL